MKFQSTRKNCKSTSISSAILEGLAPDGGLYVPEKFPPHLGNITDESFSTFAFHALAPFFKGQVIEKQLEEICAKAFDFPLPLEFFQENAALLELFHRPTAAFKDFGARFLAFAMSAIIEAKDQRERTILVATSGDTGGAVASAFHKRPGIKVAILYPEGLVSPRQEKQLTCWGDNIVAFKVAGTFDDCQALVKEAFNNSQLREQFGLTSANSINLGRVLPQMAYHAFSSSKFKEERNLIPTLIIPTGNLGNAVGAFWAKRMGSPIANIVLATNANKALPVYFDSGKYKERKSVATLANAMDVGAPSNMERLLHLIPSLEELQKISASYSVSDEEISETISQFYREQELILCPHTAVAMKVWQEHYPTVPSILSATAHPAKFESIVEPLIGQQIPLPAVLQNLIAKNSTALAIAPHLEELISKL